MEIFRLPLPDEVTVYAAHVTDRAARHQVGHQLCETVIGSPPLTAASGQPYVPGGQAVSISHSGQLALCAVASVPVGVDVERARTVPPRLFARAERTGYDGKQPFLFWWTAREANCKRLGRGFTWASLPAPVHLVQNTLEHEGETYYYSVCW